MDMYDEHENAGSKFNNHFKPITEALHFNINCIVIDIFQ